MDVHPASELQVILASAAATRISRSPFATPEGTVAVWAVPVPVETALVRIEGNAHRPSPETYNGVGAPQDATVGALRVVLTPRRA